MFSCQISHLTALCEDGRAHRAVVIHAARPIPQGTVMAEDVVRGIAVSHSVLLTRLDRRNTIHNNQHATKSGGKIIMLKRKACLSSDSFSGGYNHSESTTYQGRI